MSNGIPLRRNRRPTAPGLILREHYLLPREITQKVLARDLGISEKHLSQVINGHVRLDSELAVKLAKTLETTTEFWINLQARIDAWDAERAVENWQPAHVYPAKLAMA
ncbi:XRE family transcriptional regulator [Thalassospira profundimaris]|uniref:XRE family transcriptional regulator n=1 Tax=Thalassospira profundimaris TaxID=502049 RepID=A0A367X528_9PROT|nr:HigA family addiction module antitoxin [Thalassospira profundimaris]RCK48745.1 XRE family transcriptional regulator [Thalassospira profundimaris]